MQKKGESLVILIDQKSYCHVCSYGWIQAVWWETNGQTHTGHTGTRNVKVIDRRWALRVENNAPFFDKLLRVAGRTVTNTYTTRRVKQGRSRLTCCKKKNHFSPPPPKGPVFAGKATDWLLKMRKLDDQSVFLWSTRCSTGTYVSPAQPMSGPSVWGQ